MPTERNRYYSAPPQVHNVASSYIWDASVVMTGANGILTGAWRALENTDFGSEITLSGVNVNLNELESINTSGARYLASISGRLNNGLIGVTGTRPDIASGYSTGYYVMVGGRAVEIASGFNPQYGSGANAMFNIDRTNGALLTEGTDLNYTYDSVTAYPPQSTVVSNSTISGSFAATVLQTGVALYANTGRKAWFVANTSTANPLYVRLGASVVSTGNFNFILSPSSVTGQQGGSWLDSPAQFIGDVSVSGTSFIIWEI